jgi:cytoskeletal protein CcmA (bactofilin family)
MLVNKDDMYLLCNTKNADRKLNIDGKLGGEVKNAPEMVIRNH